VWLTPTEAELAGKSGMAALQNYGKLARFYQKQRKPRFALMPKLHYLHHTFAYLLHWADRVDWILNPMCDSNMMEEEA
jgi:hypothetical protein